MKNTLKTLALSLLTVGMLAGCGNNSSGGGGSKGKTWDAKTTKAMEKELGVVIPYFEYDEEEDYVEFEDGYFFAYLSLADEDKAVSFLKSYDSSLKKAGFTGGYEYDEDYEEYFGQYFYDSKKTVTFFNETFATPVNLSIEAYEGWDNDFAVMINASLSTEYKDATEFGADKFANVLGSYTDYYFVEGTSYGYRYGQDEDGVYYLDLLVYGDVPSIDEFLGDLQSKAYYIQEGNIFTSYYYWCLPWGEEYCLMLNDYDDDFLALTYMLYADPSKHYSSFPMATIQNYFELSDEEAAEAVMTFESCEEYGFKVWYTDDGETYFLCVDAIDPAAKDSNLPKLSVSFRQALLAASFTYQEDDELWVKEFEDFTALVSFEENGNYFTAYYSII